MFCLTGCLFFLTGCLYFWPSFFVFHFCVQAADFVVGTIATLRRNRWMQPRLMAMANSRSHQTAKHKREASSDTELMAFFWWPTNAEIMHSHCCKNRHPILWCPPGFIARPSACPIVFVVRFGTIGHCLQDTPATAACAAPQS